MPDLEFASSPAIFIVEDVVVASSRHSKATIPMFIATPCTAILKLEEQMETLSLIQSNSCRQARVCLVVSQFTVESVATDVGSYCVSASHDQNTLHCNS